jgi:hypothetical protein
LALQKPRLEMEFEGWVDQRENVGALDVRWNEGLYIVVQGLCECQALLVAAA